MRLNVQSYGENVTHIESRLSEAEDGAGAASKLEMLQNVAGNRSKSYILW